MNEPDVLSPTARLTLHRRLARWSDTIETEAVRFVEEYRDLLPKRLTPTQLSGLENIAGQAPDYREIRAFLDNRATRADKAGRLDVTAYWNALAEALGKLKTDAERLGKDLFPTGITDRGRKAIIDELHIRLVREFVQHLAAHSLYLGILEMESETAPKR